MRGARRRTAPQPAPARDLWPTRPSDARSSRIGLCLATVFVFWDIKPVFYAVWAPFDAIMGYTDPRNPDKHRLHGARPLA